MTVTLNKLEYDYLVNLNFLNKKIMGKLNCLRRKNESQCSLELPNEMIEEMRSELEDRLQDIGFDKDYNLTAEGKILENLVDKFFIG